VLAYRESLLDKLANVVYHQQVEHDLSHFRFKLIIRGRELLHE